jgi:hypothetical protein
MWGVTEIVAERQALDVGGLLLEVLVHQVQKFLLREGLGEVVGRPGGFGLLFVEHTAVTADHDDRHLGEDGTALQDLAEAVAVNTGHRDIHQNQIRLHVKEGGQ